MPLELLLLLCLNLNGPQGIKQRGRSTAGGLCGQGMFSAGIPGEPACPRVQPEERFGGSSAG